MVLTGGLRERYICAQNKMLTWFENLGGPTVLILIAAILGAIGAFWASHQQQRQGAEIAKLNQKIAARQEQTDANVTRILNHLIAQGKITKDEAQAVLNATLDDVKAEIKGEVKTPQPD